MKPPPFTPNRPICDGDKGSFQRPSKDKSAIWQACENMTHERLEWVAHHHERMAWRSVAENVLQLRIQAQCTGTPPMELDDAAPFTKETTRIIHRKPRKKSKSLWTPSSRDR